MACRPPESYADARDIAELAEPLRSRVWTMMQDAPNKALYLVSGKRTDWQQWLLRHERCPGRECDRGCAGHPRTALPGTSNHRNLSATISAADLGGRDLKWAHDNAYKYGLSAEVVPSEDWHFEPHGEPQVRIIQFGQPEKPAKPRPWVQVDDGDTDESVYARGGQKNQVTEIQLILTAMARRTNDSRLNPGPIDGIYGHDSQVAINNFKKRVISMQKAAGQTPWTSADSSVGPKTHDMLVFLNPG